MPLRRILLLIAFSIGLQGETATAEHGSPWLETFPPPGAELPLNGRIVLIAQNGPHPLALEPGRFRCRLRSDADTVSLRHGRVRRGSDWDGYGTSYVVLQPRRRLRRLAEVYTLECRSDEEPEWRAVDVAAPSTGPTARFGGPRGVARWTSRRADGRAPRWVGPTVAEAGDSGESVLRLGLEDGNSIGLRVVSRTPGGPRVEVHTQHADVFGVHDGCTTVLLDYIGDNQVRVTPVDPAGNSGRARVFSVDTRQSDNLLLCVPQTP